ncbi:MerR family transcriptional regulator [Rhizobium ruizarguesonis]|uniref:MerR family transcriptional regulator n=1 Tax=Rhizobium leguminosarum TaxID=384 RepID=UPI0013EE814F|nr:MerR family transcriptional regulator [Rhizobium leguminosarum]
MKGILMRSFRVSEVAKLLGIESGAIRIWRNRGICRFGLDGPTIAARYTPQDVLVMAWALALKTAGFDLREAFDVAESHRWCADRILAGQVTAQHYLVVESRPLDPQRYAGYRFGTAAAVLREWSPDAPVSVVINATKIADDLFGSDGSLSRLDVELSRLGTEAVSRQELGQ